MGQYFAGVGKQVLKLAYEFALREDDRAPAKTFCSAMARGPGAVVTGAWGGGEGDAEVRAGMMGEMRLSERRDNRRRRV